MSTTVDVPRPDLSIGTLALAVGDVVLITVFVGLGEIRHFPLEQALSRTPGTLVPFLGGWLVGALLLGVYTSDRMGDPRTAVWRTGLAWTVAVAIALGLRATPAIPGSAPPAFVAVSLGVGLALLVPWRVVATRTDRW